MNSACFILVTGLLVLQQSISSTARPAAYETEQPNFAIYSDDFKQHHNTTENATIEGKQDPICLVAGEIGCQAFCTLSGFPVGGCDLDGFCTCLFRQGSSANETGTILANSTSSSLNETTTDDYEVTSMETSTLNYSHEIDATYYY